MKPDAPQPQLTVGDWIDVGRRRWPNDPCLVTEQRSQTFSETARRVDLLAGAMTEHGLVPGDRVGILATDSIEHVEVLLACFRTGVVFCDLNFRLREPELRNIVETADVKGFFWSHR